MVVGEVAVSNAPIGLTANTPPTTTSAVIPGEDLSITTEVTVTATATSVAVGSGDKTVRDDVSIGDNSRHDGYVICDDIAMEEESPWEEWEEGEESADGLSMVGSMVDYVCPPSPTTTPTSQTTKNGHLYHNGHTPVITDLSDGDMTSLEEGEYDIGYTPIPETVVPTHLCLVSATVTGFTAEKGQPLKHNNPTNQEQQQLLLPVANGHDGGHPDIVFIVGLTWSDGRVNVVTRTYTDFCRLQYYLINEFVDVPANESPARLNIYLPVRRDVLPEDSFAQAHAEPGDSILLAESRELLLNQYVQELIKLPAKISASPTALTFFESRNSDPVPYHETVDSSRVTVTDQYVLCWI